jgi:hypothetical protein
VAPADPRKSRTEFNKLQKRLRRNVGRAIEDYNMIEAGDRVMVCLSGGKDSYGMLDILLNLQRPRRRSTSSWSRSISTRSSPDSPRTCCPRYLSRLGVRVPHSRARHLQHRQVASIPEGKTTCGLCSRLRRGNLYSFAQRDRGHQDRARPPPRRHHRDAVSQPVLHGGKLKAMPPKLLSDDGRQCGDPSARLLHRGGSSPSTRVLRRSRSFPAISAARRRICNGRRSRRCCSSGSAVAGTARCDLRLDPQRRALAARRHHAVRFRLPARAPARRSPDPRRQRRLSKRHPRRRGCRGTSSAGPENACADPNRDPALIPSISRRPAR